MADALSHLSDAIEHLPPAQRAVLILRGQQELEAAVRYLWADRRKCACPAASRPFQQVCVKPLTGLNVKRNLEETL
jgi:hypothetical protein